MRVSNNSLHRLTMARDNTVVVSGKGGKGLVAVETQFLPIACANGSPDFHESVLIGEAVAPL